MGWRLAMHPPSNSSPPPHPPQAAERQGSQLADAQRHEHLLEAELQDKALEGAALLADNMALKVCETRPALLCRQPCRLCPLASQPTCSPPTTASLPPFHTPPP